MYVTSNMIGLFQKLEFNQFKSFPVCTLFIKILEFSKRIHNISYFDLSKKITIDIPLPWLQHF